MFSVLDIDLDLFVDPRTKGSWPRSNGRAIQVEAWDPERVAAYLDERLGLNRMHRLPGRTFESHQEVLESLEQFDQPVHLYHLDAHADLGLCLDCYRFHAEFLALGLEERRRRFREFGPRQGDFLLYTVACGYVEELDYVTHPEVFRRPDPDFPLGMDRWRQKYDDGHLDLFRLHGTKSDYGARGVHGGCRTLDRSIPLRMHNRDAFSRGDAIFNYVFLTRSPQFTPVSADRAFRRIEGLIAP